MADAIAIVGLISSIVQILQFSASAVNRLQEFKKNSRYIPTAFQDIEEQLPLLTDILKRTQERAEAGACDEGTQVALLSVVKNCRSQVEALHTVLGKIAEALRRDVSLITCHQTAVHSIANPVGAGLGSSDDDPNVSTARTYYGVPCQHVSEFIEREELLSEVERRLNADTNAKPLVVVLHGMGGQGKTQLALEYCRRASESKRFPTIFWCNATSENTLRKSFEGISEAIKNPNMTFSDTDQRVSFVKTTLSRWSHPWLIVLDNYDNPQSFPNIHKFMPAGPRGSTPTTSRHADCERRLGSAIEITGMQEEEALRLLWKRANLGGDDADVTIGREIVHRLGLHPLAIDQAGAYISKRKLQLRHFMDHYNDRKQIVLDEIPALWEYKRELSREEGETSLSVFTTWELSYQQTGPHQKQMLTLFAFLQYTNISEELFRTHHRHLVSISKALPEWMEPLTRRDGGWDSYKFGDTLAGLRDVSLLQSLSHAADDSCHFSLHPLVSDWVKLRTDSLTRETCILEATNIVQSLLEASYKSGGLFDLSLSTKQDLLWHMNVCEQNIEEFLGTTAVLSPDGLQLGTAPLSDAGAWFAEFYHSANRYYEAQVLYERVVESQGEALGNAPVSKILARLASLYQDMSRFKDAERLNRTVLEAYEKTLGKDDPETLATMQSLASTLERQGQYAEAVEMGRQALEGLERKLRKAHPTAISSAEKLSWFLDRHGQFRASEELAWRALKDSEEVHGREHPVTLGIMVNLAGALRRQGKYEQSEHIIRQSVEGMRNIWGHGHHRTLGAMGSLALILERRGKFDEAEKIHRQVLEGYGGFLGENHFAILACRSNLSVVLQQLGKHDEALSMARGTLEVKKMVLGEEHPSALTTLRHLSWMLGQQGQLEEAEPLARLSLAGREKALGKEHPLTVASASVLATILRLRENTDEASLVEKSFGIER